MDNIAYLIPVAGAVALLFTFIKSKAVDKADPGSERMKRIAGNITDGAMAFLRAEYRILLMVVIAVAVLLAAFYSDTRLIALSFVVGAVCSALAGFIGMKVATKGQRSYCKCCPEGSSPSPISRLFWRCCHGSRCSWPWRFRFGLTFLFYQAQYGDDIGKVLSVLTGFSFGASSIALFARVGGGIYTKAADVGADLVGKVEAGIPEDHPLNPATIADNVGDNVGDVAGMGADLFESYVGSLIGAMVLGAAFVSLQPFQDAGLNGLGPVLLPMLLACVGIGASIIGTFS